MNIRIRTSKCRLRLKQRRNVHEKDDEEFTLKTEHGGGHLLHQGNRVKEVDTCCSRSADGRPGNILYGRRVSAEKFFPPG